MTLTERERLDRTITEQQWTSQVIQIAKMNGWRVCHFRAGMLASGKWVTPLDGDAGFPDLVMVRGDRIIFAELKRQVHSSISDAQQEWLDDLQYAADRQSTTRQRIGVYVWRPSDRDEVARKLARAV